MNIGRYKQRLIEMETRLSSRKARDMKSGREQLIDTTADAGDASVADEAESEDFTEAQLDATILQQVQDALRRIENGTYGQCLIDGGPIDPKRLDAGHGNLGLDLNGFLGRRTAETKESYGSGAACLQVAGGTQATPPRRRW